MPSLHFHFPHFTSYQLPCEQAVPSLYWCCCWAPRSAVTFTSSVFTSQLCLLGFQWFVPEAFFRELCNAIETLYPQCLGVFITLGWPIIWWVIMQKSKSPVPLPSNKTNSEVILWSSSLWDQTEAGTCPEGSPLLSIFSFWVLLPCIPLLVSPGNNSSVNYLPREPDLRQFHLSAYLSITKAIAVVYYLLYNYILLPYGLLILPIYLPTWSHHLIKI